ncbi:tripartite tricarboxylate transporter substrate-binding protein [Nonomuraea salmonea]
MRLRVFAALAALSLGALTACGDTGGGTSANATLRIMAPAAPGGGWDQTSRVAEQALKAADPQRKVEVYNVPGAGGTIGLAQLAGEKGNGNLLMTMGLVMVGAIEQNKSKVSLAETTPIAKLTEEYEIVVVPAESPFKSLADMVAAWKADPAKVSISGGSAGGTDHIVAGLMAKAAGVDPKQVNYIAHSGGGEALNELLGNKVSAGISGVGEFAEHVKSGKLRALGVTAGERLPDLDAPHAEGGRPRRRAVQLARLRGPRRALRRRQAGPDRPGHQDARRATVEGRGGQERLDRLLPDRAAVRRLPRRRADPGQGHHRRDGARLLMAHRWRPELGLAVVVLVLGVLVVVGTLDVSAAASQLGIGPRFFPMLVGGAMVLIGLFYVADVLRGGRADPEESEDVDADAPTDWRSLGLVSGIFLAFAALLNVLGWIIGASLLFFGLSVALGAEHKPRAAGIAVVLGVATYLLFVKGLGVSLPGGPLEGLI